MVARYKYRSELKSCHGFETWKLSIFEEQGNDQLELVLTATFWTEIAAKQALLRYRQRVRQGLPLLGEAPRAATINYSQGEICYEP